MTIAEELTTLLDDFIFRDCRIAESQIAKVNVYLAKGDTLKLVARSSTKPQELPKKFYGIGASTVGRSFRDGIQAISRIKLAEDPPDDNELPCIDLLIVPIDGQTTDKNTNSILTCPIFSGDERIGVLSLESNVNLRFEQVDISRFQVLSALVGYETICIERRQRTPSPLSIGLGRVLRAAREESHSTQTELAELIGTSRIALSRWEAGSQPPSRGPLRRWATALGILAGGKPEIIKVVDVTSQLINILQRQPTRLKDLTPAQFELIVAERLDRMGYAVQRTGSTNLKDGGIDMIALPKSAGAASFLLAIQAKHHSVDRPTGRPAVDRLLAWQNTAFRLGMLVTNTRFTQDAIWTASQDPARHFLRLRDFVDLTHWLQGLFESELEYREIPNVINLAPGISVTVPKPQFTEVGVVWPQKIMLDLNK